MDYTTITFGVGMFSAMVLAMVFIILWAKSKLVSSGAVQIVINDDRENTMTVNAGRTLLTTLAEKKLFVPSACGGGGTCSQCKVQVHRGGGGLLPTEAGHISRREAKERKVNFHGRFLAQHPAQSTFFQ